jgi:hypothetical protein
MLIRVFKALIYHIDDCCQVIFEEGAKCFLKMRTAMDARVGTGPGAEDNEESSMIFPCS